jgi:Zn-dependent protease with chaperone function
MPFLLLLFLMFICLPDGDYPEPLAWFGPAAQSWVDSPAKSAALTGLAMAVVVIGAALAARSTRRRLLRQPSCRDEVLRRYGAWRLYHLLGLCLVYGLAVYGLGWGWAVEHGFRLAPPQGAGPMLAPGAEILILAPFLVTLVLSWACFYDAERAIHDSGPAADPGRPYWGRWAYVGFHVRHNLGLLLVPVLLLILQKAFQRQFPSLQEQFPWHMTALGVLVMACLFISLPWILRLVLGLRPLPEGPLRQRLLATAERLNFRCSDILLWNTRGGVANAMVVGVVPVIRYVLLTDRLISDLSPDEVEAVFGHEVGHVKHHHMLYYLGFLLVSMAVVMAVWQQLADWLDLEARPQYLAGLPFVALLGTYIFVVFGFLSRRCERQADIYGCRAVSCQRGDCPGHDAAVSPTIGGVGLCPTGIRTFIEALEKVARLNGISRDRPGWLQSWQHSTIARRVEFLQRMLADPAVEPRFQHTVRLVKWVLLLGLAAVLMAFATSQGWAVLRGAF